MRSVGLIWIVFLGKASSLIAPVKTDSGEVDVVSLSDHVLLLEQMYNSLSAKYDAKIADLETKYNTVNAELTSVKADLQSKTHQLTNITSVIAKMRTAVSFELTMVAGEGTFTFLDHEILKFDTVLINEGNGYSKASGIFTAPMSGTYLFWVNLRNVDASNSLDVMIMKQGKYVARATSLRNEAADATVLLHLAKGEQVWFMKYQGSSTFYGHAMSHYGGVLLSAD